MLAQGPLDHNISLAGKAALSILRDGEHLWSPTLLQFLVLCQASLHLLPADLALVPHGAAQLKSCLAVLLSEGEQ